MQFTLSQAEKLYGKPRSTFHRAIKAGRLSCGIAGDGSRRIDFAELLRVYGEPPDPQHPTQHLVAPVPESDATRNEALVDLVRDLLIENRAMRHEMVAMRSELSAIREQRLLPAPELQRTEKGQGGNDPDPHGLKALIDQLRSC